MKIMKLFQKKAAPVVPVINGDTTREPEDVIGQQAKSQELARRQALAFARKVWAKQSESLPRDIRIERVRKALEAQNMSMEGVSL